MCTFDHNFLYQRNSPGIIYIECGKRLDGLTKRRKSCILCSVIVLQKLAKPVTGGVPAGAPFFIYGGQKNAKAVFIV